MRFQLVEIKGLVASPVNLLLGVGIGVELPSLWPAVAASRVRFVGYGLSLVLFVRALRKLGRPEGSVLFECAFLGATTAIIILGEPLTFQLLAAGALMAAAGVGLHLTEQHEYEHIHKELRTPPPTCARRATSAGA